MEATSVFSMSRDGHQQHRLTLTGLGQQEHFLSW